MSKRFSESKRSPAAADLVREVTNAHESSDMEVEQPKAVSRADVASNKTAVPPAVGSSPRSADKGQPTVPSQKEINRRIPQETTPIDVKETPAVSGQGIPSRPRIYKVHSLAS